MRTADFTHIPIPRPGDQWRWCGLPAGADALAVAQLSRQWSGPVLLIASDNTQAQRLEQELAFFLSKEDNGPILTFPDWETLPYDLFSPHQDLVSARLTTLYRLPNAKRGIFISNISTLMQRLPPKEHVAKNCLLLSTGQQLDHRTLRKQLDKAGYRLVETVFEHGEYAVRGSILDLFPMGSEFPYRIEFFDDEIASLRGFDCETQRSGQRVQRITLLPGREVPLDKAGIGRFRERWHFRFDVDHRVCPLYQDVSQGLAPGGIEYYLPLFFPALTTLFDYLPTNTLIISVGEVHVRAKRFWDSLKQRFDDRNIDVTRPLLKPAELYSTVEECFAQLGKRVRVHLSEGKDRHATHQFACRRGRALPVDRNNNCPFEQLVGYLRKGSRRTLICADSPGRREVLLDLLRQSNLRPKIYQRWNEFVDDDQPYGITVFELEHGFEGDALPLAMVSESQLFGLRVRQRSRRSRSRDNVETVVRNLAELRVGSPVVHIDHGVGRYLGLVTLEVDGQPGEFLALKYAGPSKLYVPVSALQLINRYTGADPDQAPLHSLGGDQWRKTRRRAAEKIRDTAAELLEIYAKREARKGFSFSPIDQGYRLFCDGFPFEETLDQQQAIDAVISDMCSERTMDRLICGDVGFGKTEVAMRAAYLAVSSGKQVAVLVPTTLLAQQHFDTFSDRFADFPVNIELLSRFRSKTQQERIIGQLHAGGVDVLIGTHKLLQGTVRYQDLGLLIIDEEHRFGVRQKEWLKSLRAEVDILTLTATPIPRTLNMAMAGLRDISIIATPPAKRLAIKTFVQTYNKILIQDAITRELRRGGQVFFVHNEIRSIEKRAREIAELVPESRVTVGHGQMRELELERVMSDFYHRRSNVLCCTTIIENGIDIPSANTIIIDRADKFGLAQLHQLRGRVGRSHHQAYAYLLKPEHGMTVDAEKRLTAIAEADTLGAGFMLATHDLEIRGAGELLGEHQSGQIESIGFSLYTEMLERAVRNLRKGNADAPLLEPDDSLAVDLHVPALIPEDYLPDVHHRLILYKRIAGASDSEGLRELQVEMIDRFGLLPKPVRTLFRVTELKLRAQKLGVTRLNASTSGARIEFGSKPAVDPLSVVQLVQSEPERYRLDGANRLQIVDKLDQPDQRLEFIEHLMERLQPSGTTR